MAGTENNGRINVLFLMIQMEMGGAERLVHNLALKLDRTRFNPSVAWFFGDRILKDFKDLGVPLYHVPKVKRFDFSTMRALSGIIKDNDIHVVNAHHFMSMVYAFYGCKIKNHAKLVYTEHSEWEVGLIPYKWEKIGRYLLRHADGVVGVNARVSDAVKKKFRLPSTLTIRNGVDIDAFSLNYDTVTTKKEIGLADEKIIGIVANFRRIKNHIFLLKAFSILIKKYPRVKLLLIGQGFKSDPDNTEHELRGYVKDECLDKNVLFLGCRTDVPRLLRIMDIFCLTSFKEGLPISLIEAMATGLPVVGTDAEGIKDVIIHNTNGMIVRPDDIKGLSGALASLLQNEDLRKRMGIKSRSMAVNSYSLRDCITRYQDLFYSVVSKIQDVNFERR